MLIIGADLAEVYDYVGRPKEAEAESRRVLELDSTFVQARCWLAYALTAERRYDEAVAVLENGELKDDGYRLATLGYVYASAGRRGEARDMLERLIQLAKNDYGLAFNWRRFMHPWATSTECCHGSKRRSPSARADFCCRT